MGKSNLRSPHCPAPRALLILANQVRDYFEEGEVLDNVSQSTTEVPFGSAKVCVEEAFRLKREQPNVYRERVDGYKDALQRDSNAFDQRREKSIRKPDVTCWMKRYLRVGTVLETLNPGVNVDGLLNRLEISRCPAVNLFLKAREKRTKAGNAPQDSEVGDWTFVPVATYADLVLCEKNLRAFIHQADPSLKSKVTSDPNEARQILEQWT